MLMEMFRFIVIIWVLGIFGALQSCDNRRKNFDEGIKKINHVVVIYMENHSFDNLWGQFPGDGKAAVSRPNC